MVSQHWSKTCVRPAPRRLGNRIADARLRPIASLRRRRPRRPSEVAAGYLEPYDSWRNRIALQRFVEDIPLRRSDRAWCLLNETAGKLEELRSVPMLICWGMQDFVFDVHFLDEFARRFPDAQIHRFDDAGHYILEDARDEVIPLISTFLAEHPTP